MECSGSASIQFSNYKDYYAMKQPMPDGSENQEMDNDEYWPLSGKPYFNLIITKTTIERPYNFYLPMKMKNLLPSARTPVVLTCGKKKWNMFYYGAQAGHKFCNEWRKFVNDKYLKVGDGLIFELSECSASIIYFKVQILNGEFPAELIPEDDGANSDNPIILG